MHMMASDRASDSSNPSVTKARVSASRQWLKIEPATDVSWGSSSAEPIAAATTGQPAVKSLSTSSSSQDSRIGVPGR